MQKLCFSGRAPYHTHNYASIFLTCMHGLNSLIKTSPTISPAALALVQMRIRKWTLKTGTFFQIFKFRITRKRAKVQNKFSKTCTLELQRARLHKSKNLRIYRHTGVMQKKRRIFL